MAKGTNEVPRQGGTRSPNRHSSRDSMPEKIADKIHYYGMIETPAELIAFYCGEYKVKGTSITVKDMLIDTAATRKEYISRVGGVYFKEVTFVNHMATFFPYVPYKFRQD